jgi:hypothetical protein
LVSSTGTDIVHDWDDEPAVTILRNCREAMGRDGKVLFKRSSGRPERQSLNSTPSRDVKASDLAEIAVGGLCDRGG